MTKNEIVGALKAGGLDASSTNRNAEVYVADAMAGRAVPGWFAYRIVCDSEATERRARAILSRWYDIDANGNVWRLRSKNRVPLMAVKRGGVPPTPPTPTGDYMYFEAVQAGSTVSLMSTLATAPNLEYSTDGETWQEWQHTTEVTPGEEEGDPDTYTHTFDTLTLTAIGDKVYLRGDNPDGLSDFLNDMASYFVLSGKLESGGLLTSLISKTAPETVITLPEMAVLFGSGLLTEVPDTTLISAPDMSNITTVGLYCAYAMFAACEALQTAADMSNVSYIDVGGCSTMYMKCSGLVVPANLSSLTTVLANGCSGMYGDCGLLTYPSDISGVITVAQESFSGMYNGCVALESAADMSSVNVSTFGYNTCGDMYTNCTFDMSNDGTTLNFDFPAPPVTAGNTTYSSYYDLAQWMGNTNGFTTP